MIPESPAAVLPLVFLTAVLVGCDAADVPPREEPAGRYVLEGTVVFEMASSEVGDTFMVAVAPPLQAVSTGDALPLVVMTDADLAFAATAQIARLMQIRDEVPPFLLVGVGYGSLRSALESRARDLTPTVDPSREMCETPPGCGGADRFLAFLEDELLPEIGTRYRIANDRTFVGASLGGLFGAYALLRGSDAFSRWILGSPTVNFADFAVFDTAPDEGVEQGPTPAAVFVGVGGAEGSAMEGARRLVTELRARGASPGTVTYDVFAGERHMSVQPMVVARGLRVVFEARPPGANGGR